MKRIEFWEDGMLLKGSPNVESVGSTISFYMEMVRRHANMPNWKVVLNVFLIFIRVKLGRHILHEYKPLGWALLYQERPQITE